MSSRRFLAAALLVALTSGCTSGGSAQSPSATHASPSSSTPVGPVRFVPGQYRYAFNGITVTMSFAARAATMDVTNASGTELAPPGVYVIGADDKRYDGKVTAAASIPDGGTASFQVTFPVAVTAKSIGLLILKFGDSNYGAFAPATSATPSPSRSAG